MIEATPIPASAAAARLAGLHELDPRGLMAADDVLPMCESGKCMALAGDGVEAVYVLRVINGAVWIDAAAGQGGPHDLCELLDAVLTVQAQGMRHLAMQTARPGLVRKLKRQGWTVAGWIMRKDLQ